MRVPTSLNLSVACLFACFSRPALACAWSIAAEEWFSPLSITSESFPIFLTARDSYYSLTIDTIEYPNRFVVATRSQFIPESLEKKDALEVTQRGMKRYQALMRTWVQFASKEYAERDRFTKSYRERLWSVAIRYCLQANHYAVYEKNDDGSRGEVVATLRVILAPFVKWRLPRPLFFIDDEPSQAVFETFGAGGKAWEDLHGLPEGSMSPPSPFGWGMGNFSIPTERYLDRWLPRRAVMRTHLHNYPQLGTQFDGQVFPYERGEGTIFEIGLLAVHRKINRFAFADFIAFLLAQVRPELPPEAVGYTMGPRSSRLLYGPLEVSPAAYLDLEDARPSQDFPLWPEEDIRYSLNPISRDGVEWELLSYHADSLFNLSARLRARVADYSPEEEAALRALIRNLTVLDLRRGNTTHPLNPEP